MSSLIPHPSFGGASIETTAFQNATEPFADQTASIEHQVQLHALLHVANIGLVLSVLAVLISALVCYPFESKFSLPELIAGHLSLILSATLVKICYVGRCVAQYGLQQEVR